MSELINKAALEADAAFAAKYDLDTELCLAYWPPQEHDAWLEIYHRQVERNEQARAA